MRRCPLPCQRGCGVPSSLVPLPPNGMVPLANRLVANTNRPLSEQYPSAFETATLSPERLEVAMQTTTNSLLTFATGLGR